MDNYQEQLDFEKNYLNKIMKIIEGQLHKDREKLKNKKGRLVADRKDMYENTSHNSHDFEKLSDAIAYLKPIEVQTYDYEATETRTKKLERMAKSPYFARIDFTEEGVDKERIYIGLGNLSDDRTHQTYICDWRAPISSIFYRYGLGRARYKAPYGDIEGDVTLKRQYEIKNSEIQYYFDSSMTIMDDILKQALSQNSSSKMKSIVETIQKEQDIIIRDIENELLIVQGVAGSGKTSVALHRVAYLMYHGLTDNLSENNIVLITPNYLFEKYIDNVLPELGEKNIQSITMEDMFNNVFGDRIRADHKNVLLEEIITTGDNQKKVLLKSSMEFKLSKEFQIIIDRFLKYFEHKLLDFRDIFYNGECIVNRHLIKSELLKQNDISLPLEKRLETIEKRIFIRIHELRKQRLDTLEKFVAQYPEHIYEVKPLARLLSLKENNALKREIQKFTRVDAFELFKMLVGNKTLFLRLADGLKLPDKIDEILDQIRAGLSKPVISYDNSIVLLAIKLRLAGCDSYKDIRQVVVDEAQDYYPLHYEILKRSFTNARFTVMGDVNQTIEKSTDISIYNEIKNILDKRRSSTVIMNKSFRCSYEINKFSSYFGNKDIEIESFERHESLPEVIMSEDPEIMERTLLEKVNEIRTEGFQSIAVICKSKEDSVKLYSKISHIVNASLISTDSFEAINKVLILPVYMAKGLEFDAVIIWDTCDENYNTPEDRQLLYISCTRALHRLSLLYTGKKSRLVPEVSDTK